MFSTIRSAIDRLVSFAVNVRHLAVVDAQTFDGHFGAVDHRAFLLGATVHCLREFAGALLGSLGFLRSFGTAFAQVDAGKRECLGGRLATDPGALAAIFICYQEKS